MATRLPRYRMTDGLTRLGETYFNPIWADLDSRLDTLEKLKADWQSAVAELQEFGLERIDNSLVPVLDQAQALLTQIQGEVDTLAQSLVDDNLQPIVDEFTALLKQAQTDAQELSQLLQDSDWQGQLDALIDSLGTASTLDKATDADTRAGTADKVITAGNIPGASAWVDLVDAPTIALNWKGCICARVTLTDDRVLGDPSDVLPGTTRYVLVKGNSATPRSLLFGGNYQGDLPVLTDITDTVWYLLTLVAIEANHIILSDKKAL